ncbi:MAG: hypothetical protein UH850_14670 [Paludibacteraceae bacterium]|nr:hypothetical protein [Paludibacteraceae bacterium]
MKTVLDYLKEHGKYEQDFEGRAFELILKGNQILLNYKDGWAVIKTDLDGYEIEEAITEILEDHHIEIRFCEECGKPFDAGFIAGDGDWYCCEGCFDGAMNITYGKGKWRPSEEEGENGGWYEALDGDEWVDTSVYYTEWY